MISTGQIFFLGGIIGLIVTAIGALIGTAILKRKEKRIQETIWKEYR